MKGFRIAAFLLFSTLYFQGIDVAAQNCNRGAHQDFLSRLVSQKSLYLQEKMGLTGKKAETFDKIYCDMEIKKFGIAHDVYRKAKQIYRSETPVSDADYLKSAEEQAAVPVKTAETEYEFFKQLKELLSPEEVFLFYHWERRFGKEMIKREKTK